MSEEINPWKALRFAREGLERICMGTADEADSSSIAEKALFAAIGHMGVSDIAIRELAARAGEDAPGSEPHADAYKKHLDQVFAPVQGEVERLRAKLAKAQEPHAADGVPATPGQAELAALVDGHFFGDGPHPLQLVCMTEDDNDVECNTWVAEVEPGTTWNELEHRMAEHALAHHFTAAVAAQEPHAADKLAELIRNWRDSIADLEAEPMDLANTVEAETLRTVIRQLEQAAPATEQPAPELAALREQVRLARQDRDQLRGQVLSLAADLEESAARTAPSKKTDIENATAARLRKIAEPPA